MTEEWPPDEDRLCELYWEDGLSLAEIAERFDVRDSTVYYWMQKYGIDRRPVGQHDNHLQRISDEELLDELRVGASVLGRAPKKDEMDEFGEYSSMTYYNRFGSWFQALEAAGIPVPDRRRKYVSQNTDASEGSV